ncbi:iron uptake transporter deferrochelatase/peroxidase subunit [Microlunatus capsulatus]|uniref:Deferrochelatase n=1 Tax=Microlunatus capsulatus TaxID=99117 RepID=A0ABS4Z8R0_9ACTN|nr:iron uptake transporter deferrochelatase/peroxidase subunit [Microlunatus capsulatus]MBP2417396.1 deferrochelatase/peroxidase EfeB [Microlunatus capsulatus]
MSTQPVPGPEVGPSVPGGDGAPARPGVSRRGLLGAGAAGVVGVGAGLVGGRQLGGPGSAVAEPAPVAGGYPFHGAHQAGIVTPAQDRLHFAAFDMVSAEREDLVSLLQDWTAAAARMTQGRDAGPFGATSGPYDAPPDDTGEALGLPPSGLTITFGFGPSLFRLAGKDRFGLAARQPAGLRRLPHFPGDNLDAERSDGDLCVQACADDPQVAVHAVRNLARIAMGRASLRWSQLGFGRTSSTSTAQATPRNLFGFKDGTMNLKAEEPGLLDDHVWVRPEGAADQWLAGGSYLVARRINMTIETWDRQPLREQERVIGRTKATGAPLSGGEEFSQPDFTLKGRGDEPLVATDAHVRLVHPDQNRGVQMLRRGYNFVDGSNGLGRMDAGLFFIAYVRDPRTHYIPVQMKIARGDGMSEYLQHTGSGLWAVPPGVQPGGYVGQSLFTG